MPIDGCFIHHLVNELNDELLNFKINKIYQPNPLDIVLQLRGKNKDGLILNKQLLISSRLDSPKIYISTAKFSNPEVPNNFCMLLRKYIERGVINNIFQYLNDRIIEIHINAYNELDDEFTYILLIELMGRNSNIILLNNDYKIIDAIRKLPPSFENERTIIAHAIYSYPPVLKQVNPYADSFSNIYDLQGIAKPVLNALENIPLSEVKNYLSNNVSPIIYQTDKKIDIYYFPYLDDLNIIYQGNSISSTLEKYYELSNSTTSYDTANLEKTIKKEIKKAYHKLDNLNTDLAKANGTLKLNDTAILLQTNLYMVKKGDEQVTVYNFLNNNEEIVIKLDPLLDPSQNLKVIFNKIKKAKTALIEVKKQIDLLENEIKYLDDLLFQLSICNNTDLEEIKQELTSVCLLKNKNKQKKKNQKPKFTTYLVDDAVIYVGKNNYQNDYLTHKLASYKDYWFHAKDIPGSHVIVKSVDNKDDFILTENIIRTAANIAAFYSKAKDSSSVPVDYTMVKNLKKVPGIKGSFVTLQNQKTIYIDPDESLFKDYLKNL